jgi:MAF protein
MYLVLASKSPRRRELLMNAGYSIRISPSDANEEVSEIYPEEKVLAIAKKKGIDVYEKYKNDDQAVVLSADTIVVINDEVLGKPKDKAEAREMITKLQGNSHYVFTAVYIKSQEYEDCFVEKTEVNVSSMTNEEIEQYIETKEPYDKAGGYGIQGIFSQYISSINGDYYNVMGLPINKVKQILKKYDFTVKLECPNCKSKVNENDKFCLSCGTKLNIITKKKTCPSCHRMNPQNNKYCEFCGADLSSATSYMYDENECPICHHINEVGKEFCSVCGTLLKLNEEAQKSINEVKENLNKKDHSETAFTLGVIGLIASFTCGGIIGFILSILAIVFSAISLKRGYRGKAKTGLILGIVSVSITLIIIIFYILLFWSMSQM